MTTILSNVQQLLDSGNIDGAREEVAKILIDLKKVDNSILDFAVLLVLGSEKALEIGLGVLGRQLLNNDAEVDIHAIWLLLAAVLSRPNISADSPSRISILGLLSSVSSWKLPIFALLAPALDSFLNVSLSPGNPLIAEQTLDFIAIEGENYAQAPHTKNQLKELDSRTQAVLNQVDDLEIKEEWAEGVKRFFEIAEESKYADQNIWYAAGDLLKEIYTDQVLNQDLELKNYEQVKNNILRLITSSLAAVGAIMGDPGLSVAVRIDNPKKNNSWSVNASVIDKLERLFQEVADMTFDIMPKLPTFTPVRSTPGSWTIIIHLNLTPEKSMKLGRAIASLSSIEDMENLANSSIAESWRDCAARLKQDDLQVDLAVAMNASDLYITRSISTEDVPSIENNIQPNIRVFSRDIPQADNLERVLELASLWIQDPEPSTVRQEFLQKSQVTSRQYSYYQRAVEILGLVDERQRPNNICWMLNRVSKEEKIRLLAYQFMLSNVGLAWFNWSNATDLSEIQPEKAAEFLKAICPSLVESTINRRAKTLQSWLNKFLEKW
jgi:hypothetical protein